LHPGGCIIFFFFHLFTCAYTVWVSSPPYPPPSPFPPALLSSLSLILLKKRHKHNKEDKAFLLVEYRIAIQRDSTIAFMYLCVMSNVDTTLTQWSLHWFLIPCLW
jgi:hypothetical protein